MYVFESEIDFENPRSLFKYRAFDRNTLQTLIDGKVWLAAPESFNDPFDCTFHIDNIYLGTSVCSEVTYVDPAFHFLYGLDFFRQPKEVLHRIFTSKAHSWSYEHEWRLIYMVNTPPMDRSYRLNARILSVSFGLRTPRRDALTVIRLFHRYKGIEFYKMVTPRARLALQAVPFQFSEDEINT